VVERGGLENRCAPRRTEGSNPSFSANGSVIIKVSWIGSWKKQGNIILNPNNSVPHMQGNRGLILIIGPILLLTQIALSCQQEGADFTDVPGVVVNHKPASSGEYLGSPGITIMPGGNYVVSQSYSSIKQGDKGSIHRTAIFKSTDRGLTWDFQVEMDRQRWSNLFYHGDALYIMGTDTAFGNITIRKSLDQGKTWTLPLDKNTGRLAEGRNHCAPVPVEIHNGRIWRAFEDAPKGREFRAFMISAPVDTDLLRADSWTFTNKIPYSTDWQNGEMNAWLEGNAVLSPEGEIVDILRCGFNSGKHSTAAMIHISEDGKTASFDPDQNFILFPGASKKFTIRYDPESKKYWSLVNTIQPQDLKYLEKIRANKIRNTLALTSSMNLHDWNIERIVLYHPDIEYHAFQYVDWQFDGEDLVAVARTAFDDGLGGAANYHDANFITFHRIRDFRKSTNLPMQVNN
jgi:hypothetical protein